MTTHCELQCYGLTSVAAARLADTVVARVALLTDKYNFHAPGSWLNRVINQRTTSQVTLDTETASVLRTVSSLSETLNGVFDITVGTYAARLQHASSLEEAAIIKRELSPYTGLQRWHLEGDTLHVDNRHTRFDLGGVIKEYAVDVCLALAREAGATAALVNFGGDLATFGTKPEGTRFVAAVRDPLAPTRVLFALDLENQALTTSGHYARKRTLHDGELSHAVSVSDSDPRAPWLSVTVVSRQALTCGMYSTSLLLSPRLSLPDNVFAVAVDTQRRVHPLTSPDQIPCRNNDGDKP